MAGGGPQDSRLLDSRREAAGTGARLACFPILRDQSMIALVIANVLWMGTYSLWSNWTHAVPDARAAHHAGRSKSYVWIPPLISNLGGFLGDGCRCDGSTRYGTGGGAAESCAGFQRGGSLLTFLLPLAPDARWATAVISLSFFALAGSVNIYALPIDIFGRRAPASRLQRLASRMG